MRVNSVECVLCGTIFQMKSKLPQQEKLFMSLKIHCIESMRNTLNLDDSEVRDFVMSEFCPTCFQVLNDVDFFFRGVQRFGSLLISAETKLQKLFVEKSKRLSQCNESTELPVNSDDCIESEALLAHHRKYMRLKQRQMAFDRGHQAGIRDLDNEISPDYEECMDYEKDLDSMFQAEPKPASIHSEEGDTNQPVDLNHVSEHFEQNESNNTEHISESKHQEQITSARVDFPCPVTACRKRFSGQLHLSRHFRQQHIRQERSICQFCDLTFSSVENCETHERLHHEAQIPFSCVVCTSTFTNFQDLKKHVIEDHEDTTLRCELCPGKFRTLSTLKSHTAQSHPQNVKYKLTCFHSGCTFETFNKSTLRNHHKIHVSDRPHMCEECGSTYKTAGVLKRHLLIHTGEAPYKCKYCSKSFNMSHKLKNHEETHAPNLTYLCSGCGKAFRSKKNLFQHTSFHCQTTRISCPTSGSARGNNVTSL